MNKTIYDDLVKQSMSEGKEAGLDNVLKYLDDYIDKNPNVFEAYLVRSEFFTEIEDFEEALADAEIAIKINPNEAAAYNNRGCIYIRSGGDINKGLADFNKAITLDPNYVDAYGNRANVYLKMRELQKAIDDCTKAIEISPDKAVGAYFNRGLAYANINEPEKALDDYNNVIRLAPDNAEAYAKRGLLNAHFGNIQGAISDYEKFLQLDPDNKNAKMVEDELKNLKSGKGSSSGESFEVITLKKEIKFICIGSIIGAIAGGIIGIVADDIVSIIVGIYLGIAWGGGINLVPYFFRIGSSIFGLIGGVAGFFLWYFLSGFGGPIWPLIRILIKKSKIKKLQNQ